MAAQRDGRSAADANRPCGSAVGAVGKSAILVAKLRIPERRPRHEARVGAAGLQGVLAREASLVDGATLAALKHDLEEPHACVDQQRPARDVRHLEHLAG
jgi:hypothetical protein